MEPQNRAAAAAVYNKFRTPFFQKVAGAASKELRVRDEDAQVLHGFGTEEQAQAYLESALFNEDVVTALAPLLQAAPDVRIYDAA